MQKLKARGISIIYISHRMEEIFQITDRVTVLRDGRWISTQPTAQLTMERVIDDIVGKSMEAAFAWQERRVERTGAPLLRRGSGHRPPSAPAVRLAALGRGRPGLGRNRPAVSDGRRS